MNKSFWQRPEGITGALFLMAIIAGGAFLLYKWLPLLLGLAQNTLYLAGMVAALGAVLFVVLDPKTRNVVWYMYKGIMRWFTGIFVQIDPIGILKSYIEDLEKSLARLSKQIGALRGQMRQLKQTMDINAKDIHKNLSIAEQAKAQKDEKNVTISARKAARLQEANEKYGVLYQKMELLRRVLTRMYENSEIVLDDTKDQIYVKEQEYIAIRASHSAIQSAMSILKGSPDQRVLFDQALETMAEEVGNKVGEMERFMDTSKHLLDSIDLQSGVFADEGLQMLESFEKGVAPGSNPSDKKNKEKPLDLNSPRPEILKNEEEDYNRLFE